MSTSPLRLSHGARAPDAADPVASWLRVLEPLLKLPDPERSAIVDELDSHLRERIRDQMLAGVPESQAVRAAIGELGDAALLARRFRAAGRRPLRRLAMNSIVLGVAGAALVTSIVAMRGPGAASDPAVYQPEPAVMQAGRAEGGKARTIEELSLQAAPLHEALAKAAQGAGLRLFVHWEGPGGDGLDRESPVTLLAHNATLDRVFEMINERGDGVPIDYRVSGSVLEVATREFFDRRDTQLVSFDISPILNAGVEPDRLVGAIANMVEQELWEENGGTSGRMTVVGERLFVSAPPRMWKKAAWMIGQLGGGEAGHEARNLTIDLAELPGQRKVDASVESRRVPIQAMVHLAAPVLTGDEEIKRLRRELAWRKVMLGLALSDEEKAAMDDHRAVKAIAPGDPQRRAVEDEIAKFQAQLDRALEAGQGAAEQRRGIGSPLVR